MIPSHLKLWYAKKHPSRGPSWIVLQQTNPRSVHHAPFKAYEEKQTA